MLMITEQAFIETDAQPWIELEQFPGTQMLPLAEPAHTKNDPHKAITDVEILTVHLGSMGVFEITAAQLPNPKIQRRARQTAHSLQEEQNSLHYDFNLMRFNCKRHPALCPNL